MYKVLIPQDIAEIGKKYLLENGYEIKAGKGIDEDQLCEDVRDCHAILLRTALITEKVLRSGEQLKIVARQGAGFDNVAVDAATRLGIKVTNAPLSTSDSVAEFTLAAILNLSKSIIQNRNELRKGNFNARNDNLGIELSGKTLGILGYGRIGSTVAKKAALGLDMNVIAYRRQAGESGYENIKLSTDLSEVIKNADFLSIHLPSTPDTAGMISMEQLRQMKPSAYIINTARGNIVVEKDLIEALKTGIISGASVDVYNNEPPAADNPLLNMENVLATPHMASSTKEAMDKMALHAAWEIHRVLSGKEPKWQVN